MRKLRAPGGCPWDGKQTYETLRDCLIEEVHEVFEAVENGQAKDIEEEIGDVFCCLYLIIAIAEEKGHFNEQSVSERASSKMIHRHPHVFGDKKAANEQEAWDHYIDAKKKEKKKKQDIELNKHFPALLQAYEIQKKVAKTGFDWQATEGVLDKIEEEIKELKVAIRRGENRKIEEEYGDVLFAMANLGKHLEMSPESALKRANLKFLRRFHHMKALVEKDAKKITDMDLDELEVYWSRVKATEKA